MKVETQKRLAGTKPEVYIIESLDVEDEDSRKEGEILSRTLTIAGKKPIYRYIRTRKELERFVHDFGESRYRYLHLSCHGNENQICLTYDRLSIAEFADIVRPSLNGKRLFVSACLVTSQNLAEAIFLGGTCNSVIGPAKAINFDDSAAFWPTFYHLMFKRDRSRMLRKSLAATLLPLTWLFAEEFMLFLPTKERGAKGHLLPSETILTKRLEGILNGGM